MRWLLLFLIVLNAVVLFWFGQQQKTEDQYRLTAPAASTTGAPGITLISEVPRGKIKYKKAEPEPKEPEPPAVTETPAPVVPAPADNTPAATIASSNPPAAAEVAPKPAEPAVSATKLVEASSFNMTSQPNNKNVCGFLGPFADPITVRQIAGRLKRAQIETRNYSESTIGNPVYWVYLRPAASRSAAMTTLRELQTARIDSFIVGEGDDANAISLGFFKKKESAESLQQQRIAQGFDAKLAKKERHRDQYWTVVQPQSWTKVDAPLIAELRTEYGEFTRRSRKCGFVASFTQFE